MCHQTKTTNMKTDVKFLIEQQEGDFPCTVFAYFPNERFYHNSHPEYKTTFSCYAHLGQHSACHKDYAKKCKQATKLEYADLKAELESIGYNLNILN